MCTITNGLVELTFQSFDSLLQRVALLRGLRGDTTVCFRLVLLFHQLTLQLPVLGGEVTTFASLVLELGLHLVKLTHNHQFSRRYGDSSLVDLHGSPLLLLFFLVPKASPIPRARKQVIS